MNISFDNIETLLSEYHYHNLMIKAYNTTAFDQSLKIAGYDRKKKEIFIFEQACAKKDYVIIIFILPKIKLLEIPLCINYTCSSLELTKLLFFEIKYSFCLQKLHIIIPYYITKTYDDIAIMKWLYKQYLQITELDKIVLIKTDYYRLFNLPIPEISNVSDNIIYYTLKELKNMYKC